MCEVVSRHYHILVLSRTLSTQGVDTLAFSRSCVLPRSLARAFSRRSASPSDGTLNVCLCVSLSLGHTLKVCLSFSVTHAVSVSLSARERPSERGTHFQRACLSLSRFVFPMAHSKFLRSPVSHICVACRR